ncbi:MAG: hypothetical protein ACOC2U_00865 [bacterium]
MKSILTLGGHCLKFYRDQDDIEISVSFERTKSYDSNGEYIPLKFNQTCPRTELRIYENSESNNCLAFCYPTDEELCEIVLKFKRGEKILGVL